MNTTMKPVINSLLYLVRAYADYYHYECTGESDEWGYENSDLILSKLELRLAAALQLAFEQGVRTTEKGERLAEVE